MTPDEADATLIAGTAMLPLLVARARETQPVNAPEWITVRDAAHLSRMSAFFFYDHWKELPFMITGKSFRSAGRLVAP